MSGVTTPSLDGIAILKDLPPEVRRDLEKRCAWREYGRNEQIIDRDSDTGDVYFVVSGKVRVVNYSIGGREVSFDDIEGGGFFGELAAIDGMARSATVAALTRTTVASMSPATFRDMLAKHPPLALAIMRRLAQVVRATNDRIMDLTTLGAYSRVYALLLRLARQTLDEDSYSATIEKLPTHTELANRAGTTRETVARAIGDLARKGVAEKRGSGLFFEDLMDLEEIVEGDTDG